MRKSAYIMFMVLLLSGVLLTDSITFEVFADSGEIVRLENECNSGDTESCGILGNK